MDSDLEIGYGFWFIDSIWILVQRSNMDSGLNQNCQIMNFTRLSLLVISKHSSSNRLGHFLNPKPQTLNHELYPQTPEFDTGGHLCYCQHTLDPQPSALNPQPSTLSPELSTLSP